MKTIVNARVLADALKEVAPGIGKRGGLDVLSHAGFKDGEVMAWNSVFGVRASGVPLAGSFALDHAKALALLGTLGDRDVQLEFDGDARLLRIDSLAGTKIKMTYMSSEDYPFAPMDAVEWCPIEGDGLVKALAMALLVTAESTANVSTPAYWCVHFGKRGKGKNKIPYVMSADGLGIAIADVAHPFEDINIPRPMVEAVVKRGKPDAAAFDGHFVYFRYGSTVLFGIPNTAPFPDYTAFGDYTEEGKPVPEALCAAVGRAVALEAQVLSYEGGVLTAMSPNGDEMREEADLGPQPFKMQIDRLKSALGGGAMAMEHLPKPPIRGEHPVSFFRFEGVKGFVMLSNYRS